MVGLNEPPVRLPASNHMRSRDHVRSALKDFVSCPECLKLALETDTLPYEIDTSPFETAPYDDPASVSLASSRMTAPRLGPALLKARCGRPPRTATLDRLVSRGAKLFKHLQSASFPEIAVRGGRVGTFVGMLFHKGAYRS
jgi:hypothetical protein